MYSNKNTVTLDLEKVLKILKQQVLHYTGKYLSKAEIAVIVGSWEGKDYSEIADDSGYTAQYLRKEVAPQLWITLSEIIGDGVQVKKLNLKNVLLQVLKSDCLKEPKVSYLDTDCLVGKTKKYGEMPKIAFFYGREKDITYLKNQVNIFKRRCIAVTGVGGIGKTCFVAKLVEEILFERTDFYDYVIWKPVNAFSSIDKLVTDLISIFEINTNDNSFRAKLSLLSKQLSLHRCLLVIDGLESLVQVDNYEKKIEYENFFIELTQTEHSSCIIVTSQLPLEEIACLTRGFSYVPLRLEGIDEKSAMQMLYDKGLSGEECKDLIEIYRANPSELESVIDKIHKFFGGSLKRFFEYRSTVIGPRIQAMLNQQFGQAGLLSNLQRQIMIYLAEEISKNSVPIQFSKIVEDLEKRLNLKLSLSEVIMDLEILEQRSLVEANRKFCKQEVSYSLEPVVKKYILADPRGFVRKVPSAITNSNCTQE
ncbi:hypothetical protein A6770_32770 [Nostoc minutum NIES-26]|uniref:Uncharacterized protein n=1 Tax=Nostoc minutum NIES-26 TaxID=1844469 RepID=A0A367Q3L9_9NOSO|nr:hypothetical protein A6770_32770 [Nostoc minutum NIES-26]